jgi:hypothetical protein
MGKKSGNKFIVQRAPAGEDEEGHRPLKGEDECSDSDDEVDKSGGHAGTAAKGKLAQFEAAGKRGKGAPDGGAKEAVFRNKQRVLVLSSRGTCFDECAMLSIR